MKRLQISKGLSELEANNDVIVERTKRTMKNALLVAAQKQGKARARDITTVEYVEALSTETGEPNILHIISMRIDMP